MSKTQFKQVIILIVLIAGWMAILFYPRISSQPLPKSAKPSPLPAAAPSNASEIQPKEDAHLPVPEEDLSVSRDPFQTPQLLQETIDRRKNHPPIGGTSSPVNVPLPSLTLQAIFWGGKKPQAIINRQAVLIGDSIEGVKIVKIKQDGVTISFGGNESTLELPQRIPKSGKSPISPTQVQKPYSS